MKNILIFLVIIFLTFISIDGKCQTDLVKIKSNKSWKKELDTSKWIWKVDCINYYVGKNTAGLNKREYRKSINKAMKSWLNVIGKKAKRVRKAENAHIMFLWDVQLDNTFDTNVASAEFPDPSELDNPFDDIEPRYELPRRVVFNTIEVEDGSVKRAWSINSPKDNNSYDFHTVALHEIGHLLNLDHCIHRGAADVQCGKTSIMRTPINTDDYQHNLNHEDVNSIKVKYGVK